MIAELFLIMELLQNQTSESGRVVTPESTPTVAVPKPLYKPPETFGGKIGPGGRPSF
tara:strand:- start:307 stop:477 length:171 start_codon:yes stop_codon:yes gene_type:complete